MKGLEIAHGFWLAWGQPFLRREFPHLSERVAVGRFLGSDVLGGDDEISRDHNWGPQFCLWLSEADYQAHGAALSERMNAAAPNPWKGFRLAGGGDKCALVESIPQWFQRLIGISRPPESESEWRTLTQHESILYFVRHGVLWCDGTGEMGAWRAALHRYPDAILSSRLAEECFRVWQHGEYNFVQRVAKRGDPLTTAICLGEFLDAVMRLLMLLDGDFSPYWKWLAYEFRKSPNAAPYVPLLEELVRAEQTEEQVRLVLAVCGLVHERLVATGTVTGKGASPWLLPLLNDCNELKAKAGTGTPT